MSHNCYTVSYKVTCFIIVTVILENVTLYNIIWFWWNVTLFLATVFWLYCLFLFFSSQQCLYLTIWPFLYKCEFIFHNVTFNLVNVTLFLKTVTLYLIMCIYLIIVTLLQLTLYLIMWLLSYNCFFISHNCNSTSHVTFYFIIVTLWLVALYGILNFSLFFSFFLLWDRNRLP